MCTFLLFNGAGLAVAVVLATGAFAKADLAVAPFTKGLVGVLAAEEGADFGLTSPFTAPI